MMKVPLEDQRWHLEELEHLLSHEADLQHTQQYCAAHEDQSLKH